MATFEFAGHTYELRDPKEMGFKTLRKLLAARESTDPVAQLDAVDTMLRLILGPDQYAHLDGLDDELTVADVDRLVAVWEASAGGALPKSAGSSKRSKSTKVR